MLRRGSGQYRRPHSLAYGMKLVITGNFLDQPAIVRLKNDKGGDVIEQQLRLEKTAHHGFQLPLQ